MNKNKLMRNLDNRIDYGVILPVFLLSIIGILSLYVALSNDPNRPEIGNMLMKQGLWYLVGGVSIVIVMNFSSKLLWRLTPVFYVIGLIMMGLLLKFYDPYLEAQTGSKNWISIGGTTFQPSELMKVAFILMLAYVVTMHNVKNVNRTLKSDFWLIGKMLLVTMPVIILILLQDDFGTMLVFLAIFGGVFLMSGISWKIILPAFLAALLIGAGTIYLVTTTTGREFLYSVGFKPYQFDRIDLWMNPFHHDPDRSFQPALAITAIGSGGLLGKGFNVSDVYVPVRESDMIFTVVGENFGFIGGCFIILLYFILIYRMIRVCFETNNEFYAYIATGIIMMILFHVFENIGANIGLLPLTGIPLPFISQGGSSILGNMLGVGLIMSMKYQKEATIEDY
ncbi:cell cycle protein FtsW [Enterococcus haemoperoxidus ATCC BAA-382]|uniref:Cell cycle protein FtsW n=1 Tax=Enterococcus haemoperoxidus ATCC BAA-382 TaxID=1158608 RepID=R2SVW6_9ENTE|nr:FtsW/RodA/SpoVE family cell cycle protein [Enterococcus haemoperoxidus]EOH92219.1 cell cycle protein FtsW [Enterococcus haemoperoxidus ATCC BAA-382]EOT61904.1 cell cycle protein FtsW [Enterococcus haemoperoxidus ATCC BAA-382]OJG54188.1 cell cycle protein FtsW [Enterococcus haemoperoxidus]